MFILIVCLTNNEADISVAFWLKLGLVFSHVLLVHMPPTPAVPPREDVREDGRFSSSSSSRKDDPSSQQTARLQQAHPVLKGQDELPPERVVQVSRDVSAVTHAPEVPTVSTALQDQLASSGCEWAPSDRVWSPPERTLSKADRNVDVFRSNVFPISPNSSARPRRRSSGEQPFVMLLWTSSSSTDVVSSKRPHCHSLLVGMVLRSFPQSDG